MDASVLITAGLAAIAGIVWLVRLEGRVNGLKAENDGLRADNVAMKVKAEAEAAAHLQTTIQVVRLQEQIKHLTDVIEQHFSRGPAPRSRAASK